MNSKEAFGTLLAGVETALEESLAQHKSAAQQGDLDAMEVELQRQKNLVSTRQQLQGLQELWPGLVGERKPAKKRKRTRRPAAQGKRMPKGARTPEHVFIVPILTALDEMGGSGRVGEVMDRVGELMASTFNDVDVTLLNDGQMRWRNTVRWTRQNMKQDGLLADDSPHGIWEMTEKGRAYLREHKA